MSEAAAVLPDHENLADEVLPTTLSEWVEWITHKKMPVLSHTVRRLSTVSSDEEASMQQLAKIVVEDPAMTALVLKRVNSSYYRPERRINTVSRAVVMLGVEAVRGLCLSAAVIESMGRHSKRDQVMLEMARALHAASLARELAIRCEDKNPEEVFVAALLSRIGELAFWCFAGEIGDRIQERIAKHGDAARAETEVLGFRLSTLTYKLSEEWSLGDLLHGMLRTDKSTRARLVQESCRLALAAEAGWAAEQTESCIGRLAKLSELDPRETEDLVLKNALAAVDMATSFGITEAARHIPVPEVELPPAPTPDGLPIGCMTADEAVQLSVLQEISQMLTDRINLNQLMEMALEGIYRGLGMDRALFAMLTTDRERLRARVVYGASADELTRKFDFAVRNQSRSNPFAYILDRSGPLWVQKRALGKDLPPLPSALDGILDGDSPFFAAPIVVNGASIGLFYADRSVSKRPLTQTDYDGFVHFVRQVGFGISLVSRG